MTIWLPKLAPVFNFNEKYLLITTSNFISNDIHPNFHPNMFRNISLIHESAWIDLQFDLPISIEIHEERLLTNESWLAEEFLHLYT